MRSIGAQGSPVNFASLLFLGKNLTGRAGFLGLFLIFSIPGRN
jgi:hypothetical protein